jgi:hypothetical protein
VEWKEGRKMFDLKNLTIVELQQLQQLVKTEIAARVDDKLVLYTHDCKGSANYHMNKYKHWAKLVTSVDISKTNGYAFVGEFLSVSAEHKIKMGSIVVEVCASDIKAYRSHGTGLELIGKAKTNAMSAFIELVAQNL